MNYYHRLCQSIDTLELWYMVQLELIEGKTRRFKKFTILAANVRRPILKCQYQCHRVQYMVHNAKAHPQTQIYIVRKTSPALMPENLNTKIRIGKCVPTICA